MTWRLDLWRFSFNVTVYLHKVDVSGSVVSAYNISCISTHSQAYVVSQNEQTDLLLGIRHFCVPSCACNITCVPRLKL